MAKFYGFDEKGKREYRQIKQRVLGGNRQTKVYKKWNYGSPGSGGSGGGGGFGITITDVPGMYIEADDDGVPVRYVGKGSAVDVIPFSADLGGDPVPEGYETFAIDPAYDSGVELDEQDADYSVYNMCGDEIASGKHILWTEINGKRFITTLACFDPPEV